MSMGCWFRTSECRGGGIDVGLRHLGKPELQAADNPALAQALPLSSLLELDAAKKRLECIPSLVFRPGCDARIDEDDDSLRLREDDES